MPSTWSRQWTSFGLWRRNSGSYLNETNYFEPDWQQSFWGMNYPGLLEIKRRYDPTNLFRVHHGVGSES